MSSRGHWYWNNGVSYRYGKTWSRFSVGFGYGIGRGNRHMFWETGQPCRARKKTELVGPGPYRISGRSAEDEIRKPRKEVEALNYEQNAVERWMDESKAQTTA